MTIINPALDITVITVLTITASRMLQAKFMNPGAMESHKKTMNEKQAEMKKLMKDESQEATKKMEKLQKEMMELNAEFMKKTMPGMFTMMLVSFPLFIGVLWYLSTSYAGITFPLPFGVPWIDGKTHTTVDYFGLYFIVAIIASLSINAITKIMKTGNQNAQSA